MVQIQHLKAGDEVVGFDLATKKYIQTKIRSVVRYAIATRIKITTPDDVFVVSDAQLFRVSRAPPEQISEVNGDPEQQFIQAKDLRIGDLLEDVDKSLTQILALETINPQTQTSNKQLQNLRALSGRDCAIFYGLHLEFPHLFFATKNKLLLHNFFIEFSIAFAVSDSVLAGIAGLAVVFGLAATSIQIDKSRSNKSTDSFKTTPSLPENSATRNPTFISPHYSQTACEAYPRQLNTLTHPEKPVYPAALIESFRPQNNYLSDAAGLAGQFLLISLFQSFKKNNQRSYSQETVYERPQPRLPAPPSPEEQVILDAKELATLESSFNSLYTVDDLWTFSDETGCYTKSTPENQFKLRLYDKVLHGYHFKPNVLMWCLREKIAPYHIAQAVKNGTSDSTYSFFDFYFYIKRSLTKDLKVLVHHPRGQNPSIVGVSRLTGFVQEQDNDLYRQWASAQHRHLYQEYQQKRATLLTNEFNQKMAEFRSRKTSLPEELKLNSFLCPKNHLCAHSILGKKARDLNTTHAEHGFKIGLIQFSPQAADFASAHHLSWRDLIPIPLLNKSHRKSFNPKLPLLVTHFPKSNFAYVIDGKKFLVVSLFPCSDDEFQALDVTSECECDWSPERAQSSRAFAGCTPDSSPEFPTGTSFEPEDSDPESPFPGSHSPEPPFSRLLGKPPTKKEFTRPVCGTGQHMAKFMPEPQSCNFSKGFNDLPPFTNGDDTPAIPEKEKTQDEEKPERTPVSTEGEGEKASEATAPEGTSTNETDDGVKERRPNDLDRIDKEESDEKRNHLMYGSKGSNHQLETVVEGELTWEKTHALIDDVMSTGEEGNILGQTGRCRFKYFGRKPVVVTYGEHEGVEKIGSIFIADTQERLDKYIPKDKQK